MSNIQDLLTKDGDIVTIKRLDGRYYLHGGGWHTDGDTLESAITAAVESRKPWPRYFTNIRGFGSGAVFVRFDNKNSYAAVDSDGGENRIDFGWGIAEANMFVADGTWREITAAEAAKLVKPKRWTVESEETGLCMEHATEESALEYGRRITSANGVSVYTILDPDGKPVRLFHGGEEWQPVAK